MWLRSLLCGSAALVAVYGAVGSPAAPGGPVFALEMIVLGGIVGDRIAGGLRQHLKLPALLWMLVIGLLLGNVPGVRKFCGDAVDKGSSASLRTAALALIMARAGLGLDAEALYRLRYTAVALAAVPCITEATVAGVLAHLFFPSFPPSWCATLGFVVAAVSPAVVVPSLLALGDQGYGVESGIPTLVVAAAALDDVFSLAGFGVSLGFAVRTGGGVILPAQLWADIIRAPVEIIAGFLVALIGRAIMRLRPLEDSDDSSDALALGALCLASTFGLKSLDFSGASALATLALAFLVGRDLGPAKAKRVGGRFNILWTSLGQPTLFALLGVAVDLSTLTAKTAGLAIALLLIAGVVRFGAALFSVRQRPFKERAFVALSWMPKATVQALVGAVPLDEARGDDDQRRGRIVLAVAVVAVLLTAPTGAIAIAYSGPRLLDQKKNDDDDDDTGVRLPSVKEKGDDDDVVASVGPPGEDDVPL